MHEDSALMESFKAGDHESFEKLIIKHRAKAVSFAQRYIRDPHLAEDMVQESFADIYVYRDRYNVNYSFKTYLFTIIKNKSIDYLRKKQAVPLEGLQLDSGYDMEEEVIRREEKVTLREKIGELKGDYQLAIHLIEYEGFSYKEAANIMGKNLVQMKILIYRARKKLKSMLEKEG